MMTGEKGFKRSEAADGNSACGLSCMGKEIYAVNTIMLYAVFCMLYAVFCVLCSVFCVLCSVFCVLCSVFKDCIGRILFVKGFFEKNITFFAPGYIFSPTIWLLVRQAHQPQN